jgi:hypothetical protein
MQVVFRLAHPSGCGRNAVSRPMLLRHPFPPDWRLLLILDRSRQGVHGAAESEALPHRSVTIAARFAKSEPEMSRQPPAIGQKPGGDLTHRAP